MPMNPRLLRPTQGGFVSPDADARAYLAAVRQADGANLEPAVAKAISDFIIGLKADSLWSAIKASCILAGARTLAGALTPLVGSAPTNFNNNFVSGDYARKTGLKGNASNKSLDTNIGGTAVGTQNDKHAAAYVTEATSASGNVFRVYIGNSGANDHVFFRQGSAASDLQSRHHSSVADSISGAGAATGLIGSSRSSSANYIFRHSGSNNTVTRASASPGTGNYLIFTNNTASSPNFSDGRLAFYSIGTAVDLALLDARVTALVNAIGAAIP